MTSTIDVDDPKYTSAFIELIVRQGSTNIERENALLRFMYQHFPDFVLSPEPRSYDFFRAMYESCALDQYVLAPEHIDREQSVLKTQYQKFLTAMNALRDRGLVEGHALLRSPPDDDSYVYNIRKVSPDEVLKDGNMESSDLFHLDPKGTAHILCREFNNRHNQWIDSMDDVFFERLTFALTIKGYDVALKFIEHDDAKRRFDQQQGISTSSSQSAASSAKTARRALWAAGFVAFGAIGNLILNLSTHWPVIRCMLPWSWPYC